MTPSAQPVTSERDRIPVLDLQAYRENRPGALEAVAQTIARTCEDTGFMLLANHGIPRPLIDRVFEPASAVFDQRDRPGAWPNSTRCVCDC